MLTIAVDAMSGDSGCLVAVAATKQLKKEYPQVNFILVGDEQAITDALGSDKNVFTISAADDVIAMDEKPSRAIRRRHTSMRRAIELVSENQASAAVSAGNTGALLGLGVLILKVIDGIDRPAIASFIPNVSLQQSCCMLDLGANVECSPKMLVDFAFMGCALSRVIKKNEGLARVGLLNIGQEQTKGSQLLQEAATLLASDKRLNFVGNIEGYGMYDGSTDVLVCNGFTGNVALKVSEGLAKMITRMIKDEFRRDWLSRFCALFCLSVLNRLRRRMDHRIYNGACFLGLRQVVVKSHGHADEVAFAAAIRYAVIAAQENLPSIIADCQR